MTEATVRVTKKDMMFVFLLIVAVCAGFIGFTVGVAVFPTTITNTDYCTVSTTESTTVTSMETTSIFVTHTTTSLIGYGGTGSGYGGIVAVTFLTYNWNATLDLVAIAVDPNSGSSTSTAFQRDLSVYSPHIPYTWKATLYVNSGRMYWLIVKHGYAGASDYIYMQLVYMVPGMQPILIS